jgi:primase-polymerase (primpol)-like protein
MPPALHKIARELRSALLGGDQVRANQLVSEYAAAMREFWDSLPESDRVSSATPRQAAELLTWARDMTVVRRAMAAEQLGVVEKASRYRAAKTAGPLRSRFA